MFLRNYNILYNGRFRFDVNKKILRKFDKVGFINEYIEINYFYMVKSSEEKNILSRLLFFIVNLIYDIDFFRFLYLRSFVGGEIIILFLNVEVFMNLRGNEDGFMSEIEEKDELFFVIFRFLKSVIFEFVKNVEIGIIKNNFVKLDFGVVLFFIYGVGGFFDIWKL